MKIKCIAFDCFGTVFDMSPVSRSEIRDYVEHVNRGDFSPYEFPESWQWLRAHPDAKEGIAKLQATGYVCVTLSNGGAELLKRISDMAGMRWDHITDLAKHRVYKPHVDAYRTIETDLFYRPDQTLMVTANPTFGDIEGSAAIGMPSQIIRHDGHPKNIIELYETLTSRHKQEQ